MELTEIMSHCPYGPCQSGKTDFMLLTCWVLFFFHGT
jgi:hypothetical protein